MSERAATDRTADPEPSRQVGPANALAVPAFRLYWMNSVTFFMAANALRFVYGWVVLDGLKRSELWQGLVVFTLGLPSLVLLMPAGVWAGRYDPKRMLIGSQVGLLVTMALTALAIGNGAGSTGLLVVSAVVAGIMIALGSPVRSSMIPQLLSGSLLYGGIALNALAMTASLVFGAVLARMFGGWFGFDGAFWWLAVLLVLGVCAVLPMESPGPSDDDDETPMTEAIRIGLRFVWQNPGIRTLFWLLGISGTLMTPAMFVTLQAHVKEELGRSSADAAPVFAVMGSGIALASLYIMRRGDMEGKGLKFMRAMLVGTAVIALMGRTTEFWQLLVLAFVMGCCGGVFINMNQGLIQANTPKPVMGRVMGLFALTQVGFMPFGALLMGVLAERIGTGVALSGVGVLGFALVLATYFGARSIRSIE